MRILALEASDFRNFERLLIEPHPRFNVIAGDNGQGKTNLLEALYLMGTLRSFRAGRLEEMVRFGAAGAARVRARVERGQVTSLYELELQGGQKITRLDGKGVRAAQLYGGLQTVLFAPEDLALVHGMPSGRRRFLDRAVWNAFPAYLGEAQRFEKILRTRNALLREGPRPRTDELLDVYDQQLAAAATPVWARRRAIVEALGDGVARAFAEVMRGPQLTMRYLARIPAETALAFEEELLRRLGEERGRDLARGSTSSGPHTDDLALALDEHDAGAFASQGQTRAIVLALKIAEIQYLSALHGEPPVLLLDDVSSELDPTRNQQLFSFLESVLCQVFVTTTHADFVRIARGADLRRDYVVQDGVIT